MAYRDCRFVFLVPLKSRHTSGSWPDVLERFQSTLASLLGQSEPRVRVLVACQDEPAVPAMRDSRVEWLRVDAKPPERGDIKGGVADKVAKFYRVGVHLHSAGADDIYVMRADADDLVHRDVARHVLATDNRRGHIFETGYQYDWGWHRLTLRPGKKFYGACGTSSVIYLTHADLPKSTDDNASYFRKVFRHIFALRVAADHGRPLETMPFPAAVYRMNHTDSQQFFRVGMKPARRSEVEIDDAATILLRDFCWRDPLTLMG